MPGRTELCTLMTWLPEHRDESKVRLLSLKRPEMQGLLYSCSGLQQTLTFRFFPPPQNQGGPPTVSQYSGPPLSEFQMPKMSFL